MENYILITEGSQDISVIHKLLLINGFKEIEKVEKIKEKSNVFYKLIPKGFPFGEDGKLSVFNIIPSFYIKGEKIILLINSRGETGILKKIDSYIMQLELEEIDDIKKIILFLDADQVNRDKKIEDFFEKIGKIEKYNSIDVDERKEKLIIFNSVDIELSIYILPDNENPGTLEKILIEGIIKTNKKIYDKVRDFYSRENIDFENITDMEKSIIGCIGNILIPKGNSTAANIREKKIKWISEETKNINLIEKINSFICKELGIQQII